MKTFVPLSVSSKFGLCGLPIRLDTYKTCSMNCSYCFSNHRKIMEFEKVLQVADEKYVERKLQKIFDREEVDETCFLDVLIAQGITWHVGGMSDPFQPVEQTLQATKKVVDIANSYGITMLFSTKGNSAYDVAIKSRLHTFQLSITSVDDNKKIEPGVSSIESRYKFYCNLKDRGFKVGIRIQPFIPKISDSNIVHLFKDADYFTIEGLKLVPQNKKHKEYLLNLLGLDNSDFIQMGLLNLKPEIREEAYAECLEALKAYGIPYSIADNDMHYISSGNCCCGDALVAKSTNINTTALAQKYGNMWTKEQLLSEIDSSGYADCVVNNLFTSNRQEGLKTVKEFLEKRYERKSSPFSPKFFHCNKI